MAEKVIGVCRNCSSIDIPHEFTDLCKQCLQALPSPAVPVDLEALRIAEMLSVPFNMLDDYSMLLPVATESISREDLDYQICNAVGSQEFEVWRLKNGHFIAYSTMPYTFADEPHVRAYIDNNHTDAIAEFLINHEEESSSALEVLISEFLMLSDQKVANRRKLACLLEVGDCLEEFVWHDRLLDKGVTDVALIKAVLAAVGITQKD